ncbi:uncharacterized protein LOC142597894 [Dermatophagoides farinae]|uniref:uncharacterized protein LOC142597894 n=1 Tax=Dermatophagoides farinae TaxID=6954 RepID=UPI003F643AF8
MKFYYELQSTNGSTSNTKYTVELTPEMIYSFFEKIPENDRALIFTQNPEKFIMKVIPIPPSSIRPSINLMDSGTNEDDLTIVLKDIIFTSIQLEDAIKNGNNYNKIQSLRDILQVQYVRFINSDYPQLNNVINSLSRIGNVIKQGRGVSQRLKGKDGRFRGNLSGKRVDFSGRTVISPDCNCSVEHVVIPEFCAKRMTYPEKVTIFNIEKLKQCILNGPNNWPGALSVTKLAQKQKISLRFVQCKSVADNLKVGDIVERHLANNDYVLFNRQPSLHRMSIMCHNVTVLPERTLRFNECVCGPYNADFDGDEMNIHLPQTEEAKAEAKFLMSIKENLRTPRNGSPVVAATQDFLSGSWLMTYKDVFFTRFQITQYVSYFCDALLKIDIPIPAIIKPVELWTGKQLYGLLIRSHKEDPTLVSLELAEKNYSKSNPKYPWMCRNDGYVIIQRSEIICGTLGKSVLGSDLANCLGGG